MRNLDNLFTPKQLKNCFKKDKKVKVDKVAEKINRAIDLTTYLDEGQIRLEICRTRMNMENSTVTIIPTIRLQPIVLTEESILNQIDYKHTNQFIIRQIYIKLTEFIKELRELT